MDSAKQAKLINEMNILRELDHPNIVKIMEYFEEEESFYIVTELCAGGEVFDEIVR
jgi:serine/threonine protein kinase